MTLTDAQLAERYTYIGGSDAAAVCGVNPYEQAFEVFERYLHVTPPKVQTAAMLWGTLVEPIIVRFYMEQTGRIVTPEPETYRHPVHTFMGCHLDGREPQRSAIVEVKHTSRKIKRGLLPYDYVVQLYHNMIVCEVTNGTLVVAAGGRPPIWQDFIVTEEVTTWIVTIERKFWEAVQASKWEVFDASPSP